MSRIFDPSTGNEITDLEVHSETSSDTDESVSTTVPTTSPKLTVSLGELYSADCNCQCVNLAALFNYSDAKDTSKFDTIYLPELLIDYQTLTKIFFNDIGKGFSNHVLNKIWNGISGFSLASSFLEKYEKDTGIDRDNIAAITKIQLHKECAITKITAAAPKIVGLNLSEFNNSLGSIEVRQDGNMCASIMINLFSTALQVGVTISVRFGISNVPSALIGKPIGDDAAAFDFTTDDTVTQPVCIVLRP